MYKIAKTFTFEAAHQLSGLAPNHPCMRLHGHSYSVTIIIEGNKPDANGMVVDYRDLDAFKKWIDDNLDHQFLNDVLVVDMVDPVTGKAYQKPLPTTAENIAWFLYTKANEMYLPVRKSIEESESRMWWITAIRVSETGKTWAEYKE